jgi:hypothetical protein
MIYINKRKFNVQSDARTVAYERNKDAMNLGWKIVMEEDCITEEDNFPFTATQRIAVFAVSEIRWRQFIRDLKEVTNNNPAVADLILKITSPVSVT